MLRVALASVPLLVALPTLNEPWGNSEESLNAAIWALGAKNLLETGQGRGTVVLPHGGTKGDGVYAHHPPLVVWLMVLPVALGGWEGGPRLLALLCAGVSLWLLHRLLRRYFDARAALLGMLAAAFSVFALRYGRLLTTLTLAAPLYLGLVCVVLEGRRRWAPVLVALLVLSSWDGVLGAAAVILAAGVVRPRLTLSGARSAESKGALGGDANALRLRPSASAQGERWLLLALSFTLALSFVAWHLITASGGFSDLLWQFRWRSSGDEVTWLQWLQTQALHVGEGLGPLSLLALLAAPFLLPQEQRLPFVLLLAPGLAMELVFRQGASRHAFWGYLLLFPAAFAVAHLATRAPRAAPALVVLQLLGTLGLGSYRLAQEHEQNQLGLVAKTLPRDTELPVFAGRSFHPYVAWYAGSRPLTVRTLDELRATAHGPVLVDAQHARALGCTLEAAPPWQLHPREAVLERCVPYGARELAP